MDPFLDPKIDPKSINLGTSKRYLKVTFFGHRNEPKMEKKQKKTWCTLVYSSVLECTLVYSSVHQGTPVYSGVL